MKTPLSICILFFGSMLLWSCNTAEQPLPALESGHYNRAVELIKTSPELALEQARTHVLLAQQYGNHREQVRGQQLISYVHSVKGEHMKAFTAMADAYSFAVEYGEKSYWVYQFKSMGVEAFQLGAVDAAAVYFKRAIGVYNETKREQDKQYADKALMYLAECATGEPNVKKERYMEALEVLVDATQRGRAWVMLARLAITSGEFTKADNYIKNALAEATNPEIEFMANYELAQLKRFTGNRREAIELFDKLLAAQFNYMPKQQFILHYALGDFYSAEGQLQDSDAAVHHYLQAWHTAFSLSQPRVELSEKLLPLLNVGTPLYKEVSLVAEKLKQQQSKADQLVRGEAIVQALHTKFIQAEERALQARALSQGKRNDLYYIVAIVILLCGGMYLHFMLKRRAIQKTIETETDAAIDIIRDLTRQYRKGNNNGNSN